MGSALDNVEAITVFVDDVAVAREFYAEIFSASIIFDDEASCMFQIGALVVNLLARSEANDLIGPAAVAQPDAAASVMLTVNVPDVDAACAALRERGIDLVNGPLDRSWGRRTALFLDPSGLPWEIAQELS
ncbi:MAG: VOC family protein [Rhodoglobus sp.]